MMDRLYALTGILEGTWVFAQPVRMCFVDVEKVYDPQCVLCRLLCKYGVDNLLLWAIQSLYSRIQSLVRINRSKSDPFPIRIGLCQGCPLSPVTGFVHNFF